MWLTHMLESRWHPQRRSTRFVAVGSAGKVRSWFDLDPVLGSAARPVGAGEPFGDQAFEAELADFVEQRSAGSDDTLGEGQLRAIEFFDDSAQPLATLREGLGQ